MAQVSWCAKVEDVSDSAKFSIRSKNPGTAPVSIALIRGIVIVGALAWAVNGKAAPLDMRLYQSQVMTHTQHPINYLRVVCLREVYLCVNLKLEESEKTKSLEEENSVSHWAHATIPRLVFVPPQCINDHEHHSVEWCCYRLGLLAKVCEPGKERLVREEANGKSEDADNEGNVGYCY